MLRVTIELFPFGGVEDSKIIAVGKINQLLEDKNIDLLMQETLGDLRDYEAEFDCDMEGLECVSIKGHDRRLSPWDLVRKLLVAIDQRVSPDKI